MRPAWSFSMNMQKLGGNAMLVDAEHAFDPAYSKALGVDVENLIVCQPDHGEMALESNIFFCLCGCLKIDVMILALFNMALLWCLWNWFHLCLIHIDFEFVISVADRMCRSGAIDLICVDSVSALTPRAEIEVSYHLFVALFRFWIDQVAHVWLMFSLYRVRLGCSKWACKHALWAKLCVRCQEMPRKLVVLSFFWIK